MGWFSGKAASSDMLTAENEHAALEEAMRHAALIMHDETERAEELLAEGTSPFHKLARACTLFVRATLGFEKEIAIVAIQRLAESEQCAYDHHRMAARNPETAFRSKIYPPGAEYMLAEAESQAMAAVCGVLTESLTTTLSGFYKLRAAYKTLLILSAAEKKYLDEHFPDRVKPTQRSTAASSIRSGNTGRTRTSAKNVAKSTHSASKQDDDDDDDDAFEDAQDTIAASNTLPQDLANLKLNGGSADGDFDFRRAASDPIDIFTHSGIAMCFGIFQLVLGLLPPPIAKFLSFLSFNGDKPAGLHNLWEATLYKENINGAIAAFVVAVYHDAMVAPSDILLADDLPLPRIRKLLVEMEPYCEGSGLYTLEYSRLLSIEKDLPGAMQFMKAGPTSPLKQVEAFKTFETCFFHLYQHQYQECADSFLKTVEMNTWAHGMYYYIAGCCYVELYRGVDKGSDAAKAYETEAERIFALATSNLGTKKILGRKLPIDIYMERKIAKWRQRSKNKNCSLLNAVGVSPVEETIYLWGGYKKMRPVDLETSLERLLWSEDHKKNPHAGYEPVDERALLGFLKSTVLRAQGHVLEARALLEKDVMCYKQADLKACDHGDDWVGPTAYYERAVSYWQEAGGESGPREKLLSADEDLRKVEKSGDQDMDVMLGLRLGMAREAIDKSLARGK